MQEDDHEGFVGERSFDYLLYQRPEENCVYRLLPEANKLLNKKPPPSDAARVIKGFVFHKLPPKLEHSSDITPKLTAEQKQGWMASSLVVQPTCKPLTRTSRVSELDPPVQLELNYHRYETEQTMEQRYGSMIPVYSRYPISKKGPYKHFTYAGKYISVYQLLDLQSEDCHQLKEIDYTNRATYNELHNSNVVFDSAFECGNLLKVFEVGKRAGDSTEREYDLILENDTNTNGYNQWFMFMMANIPKGTKVKFNIVNMENPNSFYAAGMKPAVLSLKNFKVTTKTWHRSGSEVQYTPNNLLRSRNSNFTYWQLSFTYTVDFIEDVVYFAASFPYSYSKLVRTIPSWEQHLKFRRQVLTVTPSQNYCFMLHLEGPPEKHVAFGFNEKHKEEEKPRERPIVVVTARQHPGETMSNFVLEGFMEHLCQHREEILQTFEFYIVPMVNVDGSIYGNFRSNLTGVDLNRKWTDPDKLFTPEVQSLKAFLEELNQTRKIAHFIDLHGHSKQLGTFIYSSSKGKRSKLLPYLLGEYCESFDRSKCTFGIAPSKQDTARANIYELLRGRCQSITIESSFYGYTGKDKVVEYYPETLKKVGADLLKCLMLIQSKSHLPIAQQQAYWTNSTNSSVIEGKFGNVEDEGSDEDPTADYIEQIQKKVVKIRQTYKLDGPPQRVPKTVQKPILTPNIKKSTPQNTTPGSNSLRRRITSSYTRVPHPTTQYNPLVSSTILKRVVISANKIPIAADLSRQFTIKKQASRSRLKNIDASSTDMTTKLEKFMAGLAMTRQGRLQLRKC